VTRTAERVLDPLVGKSFVIYADKPAVPEEQPAGAAGTDDVVVLASA
jgi:hypothetical protein